MWLTAFVPKPMSLLSYKDSPLVTPLFMTWLLIPPERGTNEVIGDKLIWPTTPGSLWPSLHVQEKLN